MEGGRGYAAVGLTNPKHGHNVGSALRACACYGAAMMAASGCRFGRTAADTTGAYLDMPFIRCQDLHDVIPYDCVPVAVDLVEGATNLADYGHPPRAFYVFGQEDSTLGKRHLAWCRDRVFIPTLGCMNLAATVNVVLYDRAAKLGFPGSV